jgi:hypothetical protein
MCRGLVCPPEVARGKNEVRSYESSVATDGPLSTFDLGGANLAHAMLSRDWGTAAEEGRASHSWC